MPRSGLLGNRYQIEPMPIGKGGMGVVYRAFDTDLERQVALKTIRGPVDATAIEQFRKESRTLARLCHSNIIDIYDVGEFEDGDGRKPYFVMPLLSGSDLSELLRSSGSRLDPERLVGIICQACKALHAAHIKDVVHCDLKPSNLFVLEDDCVKVIDFGIRHLVGADSATRLQGTLHYMSPEQLEGKVTPQSDIFSLAVVCYEALTGRKPFLGRTEAEVIDAIRSHIPPSISELNPAVSHSLAQVIHRGLAKQPYHRLSTAREFSELLQQAFRNESLPQFDRSRIASRVARIKKALAEGDGPYAREMLTELGSEGHIDHEISLLSIQVEDAVRARTVHQLLESARLRLEEEDYPLAMQKVQSVLDLDRENIDALALKRQIEEKRGTAGIDKWYQIARQHLDNKLFSKAREAVDEILRIDKDHARARQLLSDIKRAENEQSKLRQEIQQLYDSVLKAYGSGEISTALSKLERVIELGKRVSGHPHTDGQYESLYNEIRRERDDLESHYAEARKALETKDFSRARRVCDQVLDRRPADALFQALKIEIDEAARQSRSAAIADLHHRIEIEPDLETKLQIAKQAVAQFPDEQTFAHSLKLVRQKRDLVNSICGRARHYASVGQFAEARNQWDVLRNIYPQYPGLDYELERLNREQQQALEEQAKADWASKTESTVLLDNSARRTGVSARVPAQVTPLVGNAVPEQASVNPRDKSDPADQLVAEIQRLNAAGRVREAFEKSDIALLEFPHDARLRQLNQELRAAQARHLMADSAAVGRSVPAPASRIAPEIKDPSRPPVYRPAMPPQPGPEARVSTPSVENLRATQLLGGRQIDMSGFQSLPVAAPDSRQPHLYRPTIQSGKVVDTDRGERRRASRMASRDDAKRTFFPSGMQIAAGAGAVAMVVLAFVGTQVLRSNSPLLTQNHNQRTTTTTPATPAPADHSIAPAISSDNSGKQDAVAPTATAQERPRSANAAPVSFQSAPVPALVRIDRGDLTCHTPCELKLEPGPHIVSFSAEFRQRVEKEIEVPQDQNVSAALPDQLESVRLISEPPHLTVSIDGEPKGEAPLTVQLPVGEHRVQVSGNGLSKEQTVQVTHGAGLGFITIKAVPNAAAGTGNSEPPKLPPVSTPGQP